MEGKYLKAAYQAGKTIAQEGFRLVYGAGKTGLMGSLADGALEAGGEVVGVIPEMFNTYTLAHTGLTRLEVVQDIHVRKARMITLADAFVTLPGGFGTMEEFFEVLAWAQIGLHEKPLGFLNTNGYFDKLLIFLEHVRSEGFIYREHRELYTYSETMEELLVRFREYHPPKDIHQWVERTSG
jgi:uncharacterized protein (TIGR00730 family)